MGAHPGSSRTSESSGTYCDAPLDNGSVSGATEGAREQDHERERLTVLGGLAALSLDALSSVAYGPEAFLLVTLAADAADDGV